MFVCVCADDTCMCVLYLIYKLSDDKLHVFFYACDLLKHSLYRYEPLNICSKTRTLCNIENQQKDVLSLPHIMHVNILLGK